MQEIIVTLVVIAALLFVIKRIAGNVRAFQGKESPCKHCSGQCNCRQKGEKCAGKTACEEKKQQ